jgi:hypothetical protein
VQYKEKRAITFEEHQKIINREYNPATRAYFQLLWQLASCPPFIANENRISWLEGQTKWNPFNN